MKPHPSVSVLIAAPDGIMSSALRTFLNTQPGVHVTAQASSRSEAEQALKNQRPELLVLDCDLAERNSEDGASLADTIHHLHGLHASVHIILLVNSLQQKQAALEAGANQVILKGNLDVQLPQTIAYYRSLASVVHRGKTFALPPHS